MALVIIYNTQQILGEVTETSTVWHKGQVNPGNSSLSC